MTACTYVRRRKPPVISLSLSPSLVLCVCVLQLRPRGHKQSGLSILLFSSTTVLYSGGAVTRRNGKQYEKLCDLCCTWRLEGAPPVRGLYPTAEAAWGLKEARTITAVAIAVKLLRITARALLCTLALIETSPPTASSSVLLSRFLDSSLWRSAESLLL